jgi:hypothetical protein
MFKDTKAFSGFSVDDVPRAKEFHGQASRYTTKATSRQTKRASSEAGVRR